MLSNKISKLLRMDDRSDKVKTEKGVLALHSPDIAPLAYQIKLNDPLLEREIALIETIARGADSAALRTLYGNYNGLDLGMSRFSVYGYLTEIDRSDYLNVQNVPFDIEEIQTYGRPAYAPEQGCVVATSKRAKPESYKHFHVISPQGQVQVGNFGASHEVLATFGSVEEWLVFQVKDVIEYCGL